MYKNLEIQRIPENYVRGGPRNYDSLEVRRTKNEYLVYTQEKNDLGVVSRCLMPDENGAARALVLGLGQSS